MILHLNRGFQSHMNCYSLSGPQDEMVAKLQTIRLSAIRESKFVYFDIFSLKPVPYGAMDEKSSLVYITAWCETGENPLSELMMTQYKQLLIGGN